MDDDTLRTDIGRYLRQQRALFGNRIMFDTPPVLAAVDVPAPPLVAPHAEEDAMASPRSTRLDTAWEHATTIDDMHALVRTCRQCPLGDTRTSFVFGTGNPHADIVLIGEAPGAEEDRQGEPFVGRAGQLLNKILQAINLERQDVYICNILKCRPPNNRDPLASETQQCEPFLHHQLKLIRPKAILALGRIAGQTLLKTNATLGALRSSVHTYQGIPMMVTYHPAALLRNPEWKRPTWEDVQKFRALYDELCGTPSPTPGTT